MGGYQSEGVLVNWDEDRDMALLDKYKVWILDRKETLRCANPFDLWMLQYSYDNGGLQYGHEYFSVPECKGFDCKLKDGWVYDGSIFTTPEERRERTVKFEERIAPWIEDFGREYQKGVDEVMAHVREGQSRRPGERRGLAALRTHSRTGRRLYRRAGNLHMVWLLGYCKIYEMFEEMCKELLGIDRNDRLFNDLMAGFDHKILQTDREMFRLGVKARELGFEPLFDSHAGRRCAARGVGESEAGQTWLEAFRSFLQEYGWRTVENWDAANPTWIEKPSQVLPSIRRFMSVPDVRPRRSGGRSSRPGRHKAEQDAISRVPEDKREEFAKLMRAAQWSSIVDEEHPFYAENYGNALARRVTKEIGKRFARPGSYRRPAGRLLPAAGRDQRAHPRPVLGQGAGEDPQEAARPVSEGRAGVLHRRHHQARRGDREQPDAAEHAAASSAGDGRS